MEVASSLAAQTAPGESVAIDGACHTVIECNPACFTVQVSGETLRRTGLGDLQPGREVNLELSLKLGERLGGHLVQGHVDGVGLLRKQTREGKYWRWEFSVPKNLSRYIVIKGSVAIDGISLTVADCGPGCFSIVLIPYTVQHTALGKKRPGNKINLEVDILSKYVESMLASNANKI